MWPPFPFPSPHWGSPIGSPLGGRCLRIRADEMPGCWTTSFERRPGCRSRGLFGFILCLLTGCVCFPYIPGICPFFPGQTQSFPQKTHLVYSLLSTLRDLKPSCGASRELGELGIDLKIGIFPSWIPMCIQHAAKNHQTGRIWSWVADEKRIEAIQIHIWLVIPFGSRGGPWISHWACHWCGWSFQYFPVYIQ